MILGETIQWAIDCANGAFHACYCARKQEPTVILFSREAWSALMYYEHLRGNLAIGEERTWRGVPARIMGQWSGISVLAICST